METLVEIAYNNYVTQVTTPLSIEEFTNLLLTDDVFDGKWSNDCTRTLTFDERYKLAEPIESVRIGKVGKYGELRMSRILNKFNIPKRVLIQ